MGRLVVLLGREADVDMNAAIQDAWKSRVELVILNLSFPLTTAQNRAIDVAMEAAGRGVLDLEARIAYTIEEAASRIRADDRVVLAIFGRDRRRFERAVRSRATAGLQTDEADSDLDDSGEG